MIAPGMHITHLPPEEALTALHSGTEGLSAQEAKRRLAEFGPKRVEAAPRAPLWRTFLRESSHFFAIILWLAAGLAFFAGYFQPGEGMAGLGLAIVGVIIVNGCFSFWQAYRAEQALDALRRLLPQRVNVRRDGLAVELSLLLAIVYTHQGNRMFGTASLAPEVWLMALPFILLLLRAEEGRKWLARHGKAMPGGSVVGPGPRGRGPASWPWRAGRRPRFPIAPIGPVRLARRSCPNIFRNGRCALQRAGPGRRPDVQPRHRRGCPERLFLLAINVRRLVIYMLILRVLSCGGCRWRKQIIRLQAG